MRKRQFGRLGEVGALSLGGGGIGQVWGRTDRAETVATVREAVAAGVTYLDVAPHYGQGEAELVIGEAFGGHVPAGVRISTKCAVFTSWLNNRAIRVGFDRSADQVAAFMHELLTQSLQRMQLERLDVLFLHDRIIPDGAGDEHIGVPRALFTRVVRPTFERMLAEGLIGGWGISALGVGQADIETLGDEPPPHAAQLRTNLLSTGGAVGSASGGTPPPEGVAAVARSRNVAVIGIQPTHGGALTAALDRPLPDDNDYARSYRRAAPFRALASELGESPASLAHRYALSLPDISTVLLGVKNRTELDECLRAEELGALDPSVVARIDATVATVAAVAAA